MAMASLPQSNIDVITDDDTINWKKKYEKEKKAKNKYAKQLEHYKSKLKKANIDITKASNYYRKQCEIFKTKQTDLLKHISSTNYSSKKQDIKYVFVEDIKQIKLLGKKRKNTSIQIHFVTGDQAIFNNIDIIDDNNNINNNNNTPEIKNKNKSNEADNNNNMNKTNNEFQEILCQELQKRIEDIDNLINITFEQKNMINDSTDYDDTSQNNNNNHNNDDISLQMRLNLIEYVNKIKQRHNKYNLYDRIQKFQNQNHKRMTSLNNCNSYLQSLHENNGLWRNLLLNFPIDIVGILSFELNDRIHDVQNVKDVLYKNEEALYESINDIMCDIKYRHKDSFRSWKKTNNTHKMTQKWKHIINQVNINNARWRKQIYFDSVHDHSKLNPNQNELTQTTNDWLFTDEIRNNFIDSLKVNKHTVHLLTYIGAYLNRIIPNFAVDQADLYKLYKLYIPIVTNDPHNVIMAMLDGILFAILINMCERHCIDLRVLQLPNTNTNTNKEAEPLSEISIRSNMRIIFSSLSSLNIELPQWSIDDYFDINNTVNIMLCIVFQLFSKQLDNKINIISHPQLFRLCQNEAERQNASFYTWKVWLNLWLLHLKQPKQMPLHIIYNIHEHEEKKDNYNINYKQKNEVENEVEIESEIDLIGNILHTIDYHDYLILICCRMDDEFVRQKLYKNDDDCLLLFECITNKLGTVTETMIKIQDIQSHNPLLQQILLADIFERNNGINTLSKEEKKIISLSNNHIQTAEENILMSWINSFFGDCKLHINNLQYSLCDGVLILKLLDKLKAGCVDWKFVKLQNEIRNKFDALTNCKLIMDVCNDNFFFNLIGLNSSDIAEGNLKYINKLLYQIMCYWRNILLSEIQFNGKYVTDKMILQWINNRIKNYKKKIKQNNCEHDKLKLITIKSFRDNQLNDSILFINLLGSIQSEWINYNFVENISKGNVNNSKKDRLLNAKYCITLIRKLGQKIFVIPNDICISDPKAILSVITNIMIIAAKHSDNDQLS